MKRFSQRKGLTPVSEVIQTDSMTEALRNSLWNVLDVTLWSKVGFIYHRYRDEPEIEDFTRILWQDYFKKPVDARPYSADEKLQAIRDHFFTCEWYEVYDFLEFVVLVYETSIPKLAERLNVVLDRELSGYRFVAGTIAEITSEDEIRMVEEVVRDSRFSGVSAHIERALELYSDRDNPDFRNSIKESISAVESMARVIVRDDRATLGGALKTIENSRGLHPALKEGFLKLYGYTSDEGGIRHAMLDEPDVSASDARFFLVSCSSFVNYLKSRLE